MFNLKKNGKNEDTTNVKKTKEKKLSKKEKIPATEIFSAQEIEFKDFMTYCIENFKNGDWVLNLGCEEGFVDMYDSDKSEDYDEDFVKTYDGNLIQVYRHQDECLVCKNVKVLGDDVVRGNKGFYTFIMRASEKIGKSKLLSTKPVKELCAHISELYDESMKNDDDEVFSTHIWVPVWRTSSEKGFVVSLLDGRIDFIIT